MGLHHGCVCSWCCIHGDCTGFGHQVGVLLLVCLLCVLVCELNQLSAGSVAFTDLWVLQLPMHTCPKHIRLVLQLNVDCTTCEHGRLFPQNVQAFSELCSCFLCLCATIIPHLHTCTDQSHMAGMYSLVKAVCIHGMIMMLTLRGSG